MKLLRVLLLVIPGSIILFFLAISVIFFTPLLDEINKIDIRINLKERVKQITEIEMPKKAKVIDIKSVSSVNGEGFISISLRLTSQETQAFIEKVKNHPDWTWYFSIKCLSTAEKQTLNPEQQFALLKQGNSYSLNKSDTNKGINRQAVLCPKQNMLQLSESYGD